MNTSFNFGSFSNVNAVNTSKAQLKPYNSYKVKISDVKIETVTKKDDPSKSWKTIKVTFEGESGIYTHTIFYPDLEKDQERPKFKNNDGHEYERPSALENTMYLMLQMLTVAIPEKVENFKKVLPQAKDFNTLAEAFVKLMTSKKNVEVYIKLIGRTSNGSVYSTLPSCVGLNKSGEIFSVNVISKNDDFKWSTYEIQKQNEYLNAKPTNMTTAAPSVTPSASNDDIDIDSLLD